MSTHTVTNQVELFFKAGFGVNAEAQNGDSIELVSGVYSGCSASGYGCFSPSTMNQVSRDRLNVYCAVAPTDTREIDCIIDGEKRRHLIKLYEAIDTVWTGINFHKGIHGMELYKS